MAKTFSKSELATKAKKEVFKNYPTAKVAFMTTDGNGFLQENRANLHAKSYKGGEYFEIENENVVQEKKSTDTLKGSATQVKKLSADDLIEAAPTLDLEATQKALEIENNRKRSRSTVVAAYEARIEELNTNK